MKLKCFFLRQKLFLFDIHFKGCCQRELLKNISSQFQPFNQWLRLFYRQPNLQQVDRIADDKTNRQKNKTKQSNRWSKSTNHDATGSKSLSESENGAKTWPTSWRFPMRSPEIIQENLGQLNLHSLVLPCFEPAVPFLRQTWQLPFSLRTNAHFPTNQKFSF